MIFPLPVITFLRKLLGSRRRIPMPISGYRWPQFWINLSGSGPEVTLPHPTPFLNLCMDVSRPNLPVQPQDLDERSLDPRLQPSPDYGTLGLTSDVVSLAASPSG